MSETLEELVKNVGEKVRQLFVLDGRVGPTAVVKDARGLEYLPLTFADRQSKEESLLVMQLFLRATKEITDCVLVVESWMAFVSLEEAADNPIPPSERLDRGEGIMLLGESRTGEKVAYYIPITRQPTVLGPTTEMPIFMTQMYGSLFPPGKPQ